MMYHSIVCPDHHKPIGKVCLHPGNLSWSNAGCINPIICPACEMHHEFAHANSQFALASFTKGILHYFQHEQGKLIEAVRVAVPPKY